MLAVLPFENLTGDPNKEYLADGLTGQRPLSVQEFVQKNAAAFTATAKAKEA